MTTSVKMKALALALAVTLAACGGAEERKARYMEKGKNYFAEKNYDKAKIEFKNVLQIDPKYAEGFYYMGRIEESNQDIRKAIGNYQKAIELNADYIDAKAKLARIYAIIGTDETINTAKKYLKEIFDIQPVHLEAMLVGAMLDAKAGNNDQAIEKLINIINKDSSQVDAYTLLAATYVFLKRDDEAIAILKEGVAKNPASVPVRLMLAKLYGSKKPTWPEAEAQYLELIRIDPESYELRLALVSFYKVSNSIDKSEAVLRKAVSDKDDDAKRYLVLVEFLARNKSAAEAESELLNSIKNKPDLIELQFALVEFYSKLQFSDKAINVLKKISDDQDLAPNGLKAKTKLADIYLSRSDIKHAQELLDVVLKETPNDPDALMVSAKVAYIRQNDQAVINAMRTVLKGEPRNTEASLLLAQSHERNNETELAKEVLTQALAADPLNPKNHLNLSNYYASKNDLGKAEETLNKALSYFKSDLDLMQAKLQLAAIRKDENTVKAVLDDMKKSSPDNEKVLMQRGQYFVSKKQYSQALEEFESALKNSLAQMQPLEAIVRTYISMGQENKAVEKLQARLKTNPNDVLANDFLGQIAVSHGDFTRAQEYFAKAMSVGNWDAPYLASANSHLMQKNYQSAIAVLENGVAKIPNSAPLHMQLAAIYEGQKEYTKAVSTYKKVLDMNPANQMAANNMASLLLDFMGDAESVKQALQLTDGFEKVKHPALLDTLGWANVKNNNAAKAVSVLEEVIRMAPDVGIFQYHLGVAYQQVGNVTDAKKYLNLATSNTQDYPGKDKAKEMLAKL